MISDISSLMTPFELVHRESQESFEILMIALNPTRSYD